VQTPSISTPSAPSVGGVQQQVGSAGTGATGATTPGPSTAGADSDKAATGAGSGGSSGTPTSDGATGGHGSSGPADAPSTRRDRIVVGGTPDHRRGRAVAQRWLEVAVAQGRQCLEDLSSGERRVLGLRAGLGPDAPLTRPEVARRLDLGVAQTGRIERRGLRRLDALVDDGACGGVGTVSTAGTLATGGSFAVVSDGYAPGADRRPHFGVGGVVAHGGGDSGSGGRSGFDALPPPIGDGGEATLLVALGLLVALALLVRRELSRR
jgi:hypothetical protein